MRLIITGRKSRLAGLLQKRRLKSVVFIDPIHFSVTVMIFMIVADNASLCPSEGLR